jgi:hypothetical protein
MIELTLELLTESLLIVVADSAGRRAASKTNKSNTMARKVSMIGGISERKISQLERKLWLEVDP